MLIGSQEIEPIRLKALTTKKFIKGKVPDPDRVIMGITLAYKDIT